MTRPFTDSTALRGDADALRERAWQDGYLLIRGLLPKSDVEAVAADLARPMAAAGWIPARVPLGEAVTDLSKFCVEPQPAFMEVFYQQLSMKSLYALNQHPALIGIFRDLFGEEPFCAPHCVTRMAFPGKAEYATPAHQDYVHFEGSTNNWAAWIPFTPTGNGGGGLTVAAGSHKGGPHDMRPALGAGQMVIDADLDALDWRWSPMEPGDVLIHNCLNIHRGLPNTSKAMRVSVDARYQPLSEPLSEKFIVPSHQMKSWDDLYAGWEGDDLKYYWRDLPLTVVPFEYKWYDRRDELAIAMGEAGDPEALVALQNVSYKHRDPAMRARAEAALATLQAVAAG